MTRLGLCTFFIILSVMLLGIVARGLSPSREVIVVNKSTATISNLKLEWVKYPRSLSADYHELIGELESLKPHEYKSFAHDFYAAAQGGRCLFISYSTEQGERISRNGRCGDSDEFSGSIEIFVEIPKGEPVS